ncbi:MAG: PAS domain S-box protein [Methanoregula sp.]
MDLTIIQSSVTLFEILCVIIVFASIFMRSRFFNEVFEHHPAWTTQILLVVFFGIMSIFGTLSGLSIYGAVVNVRDLGPMAAGLLCGPYIGIGSGIIGGLFRFAQGGPYMWTGLSAPIISGILGGIMYLANKRQFVPVWVAVILIGFSETLISCYTLILVTKPSEFFTVVTTVAVPMVVFNIIGMFIFATVVYNILDERRAQKEMQVLELEVESKRNLSTIINTIAYPVYVLDRDHRFVLVNDSLCRFIGRTKDEILTRTPRDFFREGDSAFHMDMTEDVFHNQTTLEDEVTVTKPDGQKYTIISTSTLYRDAPCVGFVVGVIQDITQRKRAEEALHQKNEEVDRYFTNTLDLLCIADMDGYFRRLNKEWEAALGYTPAELEGKRFLDFVHPDDMKATLGSLSELRAGKNVLQFMNRYQHRDGSYRWIEWRSFPAGNVFYASARDITERKKMTEQIEASLAEKETLLKEVYHRVKNNLQIIASLLNLQIRKIDDPITVEALKDCQNQVRSMALVHEHLYRGKDFSHIDLGNYIRALGTALLKTYEAGNRGVRFDLDIHDIYVDTNTAIPLGLISNELITNCLKYAFKGKDGGWLSITASEDPQSLTVVIADNGVGMPPGITLENQTSLGLKLVDMLTDQLNGTVVIDRTGGTKFTFTFPKSMENKPSEGSLNV